MWGTKGRCNSLGWVGAGPHVEVLHRLGNVELVHSSDDNGRRGQKEEEDEEDDIDDKAAQPPDEASDGEVLPEKQEVLAVGTGDLDTPLRGSSP